MIEFHFYHDEKESCPLKSGKPRELFTLCKEIRQKRKVRRTTDSAHPGMKKAGSIYTMITYFTSDYFMVT